LYSSFKMSGYSTAGISPYEQQPSSGDVYRQVNGGMGSGAGKIFVGGLSPSVTSEGLIAHFSAYGEVLDATIMNDKITGRPRGFGFVTFRNPEAVDSLMKDNHVLDGKQVECKRAVPMGYIDKPAGGQPAASAAVAAGGPGPAGAPVTGRSQYGGPSGQSTPQLTGRCNPEKIFVGGLPASCDDNKLREYFSKYGIIVDAVVMIDRDLQRHRGFGYVLFQDAGSVDAAVNDHESHQIDGKWVDVKRCIVQENSPWPGGVGGAQSGPMRKGGYKGSGGSMIPAMPGVSAQMPGYYGAPAATSAAPTARPYGDYGSYYASAASVYGRPATVGGPTAATAYRSAVKPPTPATSGYGMGGYAPSAYGAPQPSPYGYGPSDPYSSSGYGATGHSPYGAMPGYGTASGYGGYASAASGYGQPSAASAYGSYMQQPSAATPGAPSATAGGVPPTSPGAANPNDIYAAGRRSGYRTSPY
jgi:RNA-binding protein Musashi